MILLAVLLAACSMPTTSSPPAPPPAEATPAPASAPPPPAPAAKMSAQAYMECERLVRDAGRLDEEHPTGPERQKVLDAALAAQATCRPHAIQGPWADGLVEKLKGEHAAGAW